MKPLIIKKIRLWFRQNPLYIKSNDETIKKVVLRALSRFLWLWLSLQVSGVVETGQYVYFKALITNPRASIKILLKSKSGDPDLVPKP